MSVRSLVYLFICLTTQQHLNDGLYKLIGADKTASQEEITQAYIKTKEKLKGKKNIDPQVERAYRILSNRAARTLYDTDGESEVRNYESLGPERAHHRYRKGASITTMIELSLAESLYGVKRIIPVKRISNCRQCAGTGAFKGEQHKCSNCKGRGMIIEQIQQNGFNMQYQRTCPVCGGKGIHRAKDCPHCGGGGLVQEETNIEVNIPGGVLNEEKIIIYGEGSLAHQSIPGDLIIEIRVLPNTQFERKDIDLITYLKISLEEAVFGFSKNITSLDSRRLTIEKNGTSQWGSYVELEGEGFPARDVQGSKGNLKVQVTWDLPTSLTDEQQAILQELENEFENKSPASNED